MVAAPKPGDVVWAKLKGYRWWPAKIEDEMGLSAKVIKSKPKKKFTVIPIFFYGSSDYAWLGYDSILPFLDNYDRLSSDPSKPQLFRKSLDDANKALGRFTEISEHLQSTPNPSDVAKFLEQAGTLSAPLKKKRGRPNKILETNKGIKKEIKFNKIPASNQIKQDKTPNNISHDSASETLLKIADPSVIDDSEGILSINEELETTENNIVKTSIQKRVRNITPRSKKVSTKDSNSEGSPIDLGKSDSRNVLKKRGRPAKNAPIPPRKRGRPSRLSTDPEPNKEQSINVEKINLGSDSHDSVEITDDLNQYEKLTNLQATLSPLKYHQINGTRVKDPVDKASGSNFKDGLSSSENEAITLMDQSNIPIQLNQELEKSQDSNSQPSIDTLATSSTEAAILCREEAISFVEQDSKLLHKTSTLIEDVPVSSHITQSSRLFESPKPSTVYQDMCQLRHELQKLAITEKMKNRSKLESTLNKIESSSPTADDLMKSKIIKVFRHIIRDKVTDPSDKISVHCKNLYKRFKAILEEENDKKDSELQDNSMSFNPDTSILTSNSVY